MKHRNLVLSILLLVISVFALSSMPDFTQSTSAQINRAQTTIKQKSSRPSPRIKAVINGAEKPNQIPDNVAYELFLRTVAEGNARALVKRAGFKDKDVEQIMSEAYSLNQILEMSDKRAREIKQNKNESPTSQAQTELTSLQEKRDEAIARTLNRYLPQDLREEGMNKLQSFITKEVKRNVQKILVKDVSPTNELAFNKSFVKSFASRQNSSGGQIYLYSTTWQDGTNVYGSGSLSEQYASSTSYRVTTTVTSPSGRSNTTFSDWSYAPVSNDAGLSKDVDDGNYNVDASFEADLGGYYDEFGNHYSSGIYNVGSATDSILVVPFVRVGMASISPNVVIPSSPTSPSSGKAKVSIGILASRDVLAETRVKMQLLSPEATNVKYSVDPSTGRNIVAIPESGRGNTTVFEAFTVDATEGTGTLKLLVHADDAYEYNSLNPADDSKKVMIDGGKDSNTVTLTVNPPNSSPPSGGSSGAIEHCYRRGYEWNFTYNYCDTSNCTFPEGCSPIVIDTRGDGFSLTDAINGVWFDLGAVGTPSQISWTSTDGDDAWLALDRNRNNRIDDGKELFGTASEQPDGQNPRNGFASLAMFDTSASGGNGDGQITRADTVFAKLRLWLDRNHNGVSEPEELYRLPALDVVAISLDYKEAKRADEFGNRFRFRSKVRDSRNVKVGRWAWDVFLNVAP